MAQAKEIPEWTDALSVGVDILDEDHQAFFRLPAVLQEILSCQDENQDVLIETAINILEEYVAGHFLREEGALAAANYPNLAEHIAIHDRFAARVSAIADRYRGGDKTEIGQLSELVTGWIFNHITTVDADYRGYLTNENVDNRPLACLVEHLESEMD